MKIERSKKWRLKRASPELEAIREAIAGEAGHEGLYSEEQVDRLVLAGMNDIEARDARIASLEAQLAEREKEVQSTIRVANNVARGLEERIAKAEAEVARLSAQLIAARAGLESGAEMFVIGNQDGWISFDSLASEFNRRQQLAARLLADLPAGPVREGTMTPEIMAWAEQVHAENDESEAGAQGNVRVSMLDEPVTVGKGEYAIILKSDLDALRSEAGAWRPIETAPKDGTAILGRGFTPAGSGYRRVIHWSGRWYRGENSNERTFLYETEQPIDWQPLPLPPATETGG